MSDLIKYLLETCDECGEKIGEEPFEDVGIARRAHLHCLKRSITEPPFTPERMAQIEKRFERFHALLDAAIEAEFCMRYEPAQSDGSFERAQAHLGAAIVWCGGRPREIE